MIHISEQDSMADELANLKMELRSRIEKLEKRMDAVENSVSRIRETTPLPEDSNPSGEEE